LKESDNNETNSYNTRRLLCKKNFSTTAIGEMVMSREVASKASDVNRSSAMVERSHDFNRRSIEKVRSGDAVVTGKVHKICSSNLMFGYKTGHCSKASNALHGLKISVFGVPTLFHLFFHRINSASVAD